MTIPDYKKSEASVYTQRRLVISRCASVDLIFEGTLSLVECVFVGQIPASARKFKTGGSTFRPFANVRVDLFGNVDQWLNEPRKVGDRIVHLLHGANILLELAACSLRVHVTVIVGTSWLESDTVRRNYAAAQTYVLGERRCTSQGAT